MLILHVHWQPPLTPSETGGILFWAETGDAELPANKRGRLAKNPKPKNHPFCAPIPELRSATDLTGKESAATLRLPTTRTGPLPSPELSHAWEQDKETPPSLAPWIVHGIWLASDEAVPALLRISASGPESKTHFGFAASFHFWSRAAALVLETLAAHKLLPVLVPADADGKIFHARWLPVLDSPHDSQRLAQLEAAMPPVCRAQVFSEDEDFLREACLPAFSILPVTPWPANGENLPLRYLPGGKTPSPTAGSKHCSARTLLCRPRRPNCKAWPPATAPGCATCTLPGTRLSGSLSGSKRPPCRRMPGNCITCCRPAMIPACSFPPNRFGRRPAASSASWDANSRTHRRNCWPDWDMSRACSRRWREFEEQTTLPPGA